jgi:alcohol dehydrogenase class IV
MTPPRIFRTPRNIVWGRGSFSHLEQVPARRVLIVTDQVLTKLGVTDRAISFLKKSSPAIKVFDDVEPQPSVATVMRVLEEHRNFNPDVIVGIGGGSAIDVSKAFRVFLEHPGLKFEEIRYFDAPPKTAVPPLKNTFHVAIPSTSGTGSEVSYACSLTDAVGAKSGILSQEIIPDMAIVDPDIAETMPKVVLADSGFDALTHGVESYISTRANDLSRANSLQAISLIVQNLPLSFRGGDPAAKEHMHYAATLAGIGFANSANGICHTIAGRVGAAFKLTHGRANAIALPYTIKYHTGPAAELFKTMAQAIGFRGDGASEAVDYLIQRIRAMGQELSVPASFKEAGIEEMAYFSKIDRFAAESSTTSGAKLSLRQPSPEEFKSLYAACYKGDYGLIA